MNFKFDDYILMDKLIERAIDDHDIETLSELQSLRMRIAQEIVKDENEYIKLDTYLENVVQSA